ncbi:MAG: hypothetical protein J0L86_00575 [Flavobacteriales bacterium]|nr:hypothetical protein [Flavobacteriales bacterium]
MKKFIEALYNSETKKVMVRNPKDTESWIPVENLEAISSGFEAQCQPTKCTTITYEVCQGVHIGPAPDYIQTPFGCKTVTETVCE